MAEILAVLESIKVYELSENYFEKFFSWKIKSNQKLH